MYHLQDIYLLFPRPSDFFLFSICSSETEEEISNLNVNKDSGPFSIPTKILNSLKELISKPLEILFNCSFSLGVFPHSFKTARVLPVFKKGSETSPNNYRPISLLSNFNGILERLMYKRLINFIDQHNILFNKQLRFRPGHSTDHDQAILCILDNYRYNLLLSLAFLMRCLSGS